MSFQPHRHSPQLVSQHRLYPQRQLSTTTQVYSNFTLIGSYGLKTSCGGRMRVFLMFLFVALSIVVATASPNNGKGKGKGNGNGGNSGCNPLCASTGECRRALQGGAKECCCDTGYQGATCDDPVCIPACRNGGTCTSPGNCTCPTGYTGDTCEISLCTPTCKNNGTCDDSGACDCTSQNFTGDACEREYKGCFEDQGVRDLGSALMESMQMTVQRCQDFCKGFTNFGVQDGGLCFCGDSYGRYQEFDESFCNVPCNGDSSPRCGATFLNSIYEVTV